MPAARLGARAFSLRSPEAFLRYLHDHPDRVDFSGVSLVELWSLAAVGALGRKRRASPLEIAGFDVPAGQFAHAVGLDELVACQPTQVAGEPGKTVRLHQVWSEEEVEETARETAALLAGEDAAQRDSRDALQYMMAELVRNVLQHSDEALGAVTGAQRNNRGLHEERPVFQVAIVDNGRGIRASLSSRHDDIDTDEVALERSLWPHFSRAFAFGRTGGERNAGLGLFYVSEMVKALEGRLLVSSGGASLFIDTQSAERQRFLSVGYPGTLVAFEIPVEAPKHFGAVFEAISDLAEERTPRRLVQERLRHEAAPEGTKRFLVSLFLENNDEAHRLATEEIVPRLVKKESVTLDFLNVRLCTQSFAHALLFEALRISWATRTPIYIAHAAPVVRSALKHVEMYSQSG